MVWIIYDWIRRILHVCAKVPKVGRICGTSDEGKSLNYCIRAGCSTQLVYSGVGIYASERLMGIYSVLLTAISSLDSNVYVSDDFLKSYKHRSNHSHVSIRPSYYFHLIFFIIETGQLMKAMQA
jgi:hypothetical protein